MLPVIAIVGRPNVGKSTLFNRLTGTRNAIVANYPGLTRDRQYGEGELLGRRFVLVDTGGITGTEEGLDAAMASQSMRAMEEADAILFMVDARDGLTPTDEAIANYLRPKAASVYLVVNKIDGLDPNTALFDFYSLGFAALHATTATHGRGVKALVEAVIAGIPPAPADISSLASGIKMAVVGRPNVGKSTLVNRLLGEDRVVVYDEPGTTRDSIHINYERDGKSYTLIDTAG
ncbi:MAG: ribosome biogenesis GTPase Der, partial [Porticoccaceae bacterium]